MQTANSASASTRFREQSLQQELELTKKNNEWFENELKTKSNEYMKYRKEKSARISELQNLNEEANSNVDSLKRNENALKSRLDDVEQKYEDSLGTVQQLKEEAIQAAESFRIELDSSSRLAELQKNSAETAKQRVQECQVALEKAKDDAAAEISRLRAEIETEHSDKEAAERRVAELELNIGQLESELAAAKSQSQPMSPARNLNGTGVTTPLRPGTPVGSFSPRTSRTKGGLTLTQMYTEYDKMRTSLANEQKENQELKSTVEEMMQELEAKKPEFDELREEHQRLETAVIDMSNLLDTSGKERDEATREARKWQGQVEGLTREGDILRQQLRDLGSQVKVLVMEVHLAKEGERDYNREELEKLARDGIDESVADMNNTGRFISRHLTTFKNLEELQEQNVTLRRMLRELGDKMEGAEAREKEAAHQKDQEELKELRTRVQTYRDEMTNLVAQTQSYVKERDTFRSMLTRRNQLGDSTSNFSQSVPLGGSAPAAPTGGSDPTQSTDIPDYAELLRKVQAHFDSFRQETATDHSALKQQVNDLSRKNSELQSEISRSSTQLGAAAQRAENLQSNLDMLKKENFELQNRYSTILENSNKQDLKTQQAAEELVEARGLLDSLHRETANLKAEKELWKNIEKRLIEDNESLRNERARLDSLNANLQNMLNEREHTDSESRRRLQTTVENLESELQTTKRKLNDETEEGKRAALRREYEHEQSQKRIDDLVASLSSVREELISTKTTRDHLQSRVDELGVEMRSAEERLQVLQSKPSAAAVSSEAMDTGEGEEESGMTREQQLGVEVSELKRDLDLAKGELAHAKEQVENYKAISQATEERLQELNDTNEQYREDTDRLVEEKSKKISDLEQRIEEISAELSDTNNELTKLRDVQADADRRLQDQKTTYEEEISRLKDQDERYAAAAQYHQQDLKAQAEIAQRAQQNYESELVKHAEAAKNLQTVREEANQLRLESVELRTQADSAKNSLAQREESWKEIQEQYERELSELRQRREEVLNQNSLLHGQLEGITNQISSLQRDRANIAENDEDSSASSSSLEGLQEVIKFLRREKEIVDVQYHLSTQESKRLRQQLDYTQSQLDETQLKLEQQRRAEAENATNSLDHNKLMNTLNELNLFRESSVTLRNQVKQAETAVTEKTARIDELVQEIEPLQTRIKELENLAETKDGEMKLLQEDRDRWQQRTQNILHKYDRVDPADMEALKEKLSTMEKERDEAVSSRESLQAEVDKFPEQLKERVNDLRSKLAEQFKARSKDLTSKINAKQTELNAMIQEKDAIQLELNTTKEELNELKSKATEQSITPTPAQGAADTQQSPPTQPVSTPAPPAQPTAQPNADQIKALEDKIRRLEAALAEKDAEAEKKIKERVDRMKETLNNKLAEYKASHKEELEKLEASHKQKLESLSKPDGIPELTDPQARELVAKNETIRTIVRNNIRTAVNKEKESLKASQTSTGPDPEAVKELEKKFNEEKEALLQDRDQKIMSAVELAEKKLLAKISMTEGRARNMQTKVEVVQKAATDTPQRPVSEVWEIAKTARAPPPQGQMQKPGQTASPSQAPTPAQAPAQPPAAVPSPRQQAPSGPEQAPAPAVPTTPVQEKTDQTDVAQQQQQPQQAEPQQQQPQPPQGGQTPTQAQQQTASPSLPNKPPQGSNVGTGASTLRALQSGLPVARGGGRGAGRGTQAQAQAQAGQHNPFGPQAAEQQQQQPQTATQPPQQQQSPGQQQGHRGSGFQRGRGRGRGGGQTVQTGNVSQGQGQSSPGGGRGGLSAQARQFIPQGNKRTREDSGDGSEGGNIGKRMRGGGQGQGRGQ